MYGYLRMTASFRNGEPFHCHVPNLHVYFCLPIGIGASQPSTVLSSLPLLLRHEISGEAQFYTLLHSLACVLFCRALAHMSFVLYADLKILLFSTFHS
jgi:hypothetical protein